MFAIDYDPLALGYVTSLARPTGNVTGLFFQQIALSEKRLQRMKDAFSPMRSATVLWDAVSTDQWRATQGAATKLGLQAVGIEFRGPPDQREFIDVRNGSRSDDQTCLLRRQLSPGPDSGACSRSSVRPCSKTRNANSCSKEIV
jgi:hypothetical protein